MKNRLLKRLERLVNHTLSLDGAFLDELGKLSGKVISLEFINTELNIFLLLQDAGIYIISDYDGEVHVRIRGTPSDMFAYLISARQGSDNFTGTLEIAGDVGLAQRFQTMMRRIDIDWEEHLSHLVGDTLAHKAGNLIRKVLDFSNKTKKTLALDISEYLLYEKEVLPERSEVDAFTNMVDELRNDVERLKARINRINQAFSRET